MNTLIVDNKPTDAYINKLGAKRLVDKECYNSSKSTICVEYLKKVCG
jgi:hypothetical protein